MWFSSSLTTLCIKASSSLVTLRGVTLRGAGTFDPPAAAPVEFAALVVGVYGAMICSMYVYVYACKCVSESVCVFMYVCIYVCMYGY